MKLSFLTVSFLLVAGLAVAGEMDDAYQSLQEAQSRKDVAQVKKLAAETHKLAAEIVATPAPKDEDELKLWKDRVAYAKDVDLHTEYALYATALEQPPAGMVDLLATLERQNPKSTYWDLGYSSYFAALTKLGKQSQILPIAQKALTSLPDNEDCLLVLADHAMTNKQPDRAVQYATRLTNALKNHPRPEGMSAADWESRRNTFLGRGYWIAGVIQGEKNSFYAADVALRAALPLIQGNDAMLGPALFYLGVANYQLGRTTMSKARMMDAIKFSEQAAKISGPYSQQAWHNAIVCKAEATKMR